MRHLKSTAKLGRTGSHRNAMLANLVCSLIKHKRVTTTLAKAKAARSMAEKMVTLGKKGSIHNRRVAESRLHQDDAVRILFNEIAPTQADRPGGYTRIIKLQNRRGDAAQMAILEFVDLTSGPVTLDDESGAASQADSKESQAAAPAAAAEEVKAEDSAAEQEAPADEDAKSDDSSSEAPEKKE